MLIVEEFKAPSYVPPWPDCKTVFLAGAIDMGAAIDWQTRTKERIGSFLTRHKFMTTFVQVFNPRRDDWDASWQQTVENKQFRTQVTWELEHINKADVVFFYFPKESKAPISFFELGLCVGKGKRIILFAEPGFYRMGNLEVIALQHKMSLYTDYEFAMQRLAADLGLKFNEKDTTWNDD